MKHLMLGLALFLGASFAHAQTGAVIPDELMTLAGLTDLEKCIVKEAALLPGGQFQQVFKKLETSPSLAYKMPADSLKLETVPFNDETSGGDPQWIKATVEAGVAGTGAAGGVGGGNTGAGSGGGGSGAGGS